jgi:transposase-like protein
MLTIKKKTKRHFSPEEKQNHVINLNKSGLRLSDYCRSNNLSTSTLSTWRRKHKIPKSIEKPSSPAFKQVHLTNPVSDTHPELMVNVRGNMKLYFKTISNVPLISSLLKELG